VEKRYKKRAHDKASHRSGQNSRKNQRSKVKNQSIDEQIKDAEGKDDKGYGKENKDWLDDPVQDSKYERKNCDGNKAAMQIEVWKKQVCAFYSDHRNQQTQQEIKHSSTREIIPFVAVCTARRGGH
jgi:hypothetical protein